MSFQLFWGDLHSHCSISYGHGTAEQALLRARQQLDFCSVIGHAFWPDMPDDRGRYAEIIDYHNAGFATLAKNWDRLLKIQDEAGRDGEFLALLGYEWHSLQYGDHNVYAAGPQLPLQDAPDLPRLRAVCRANRAIAIPHHIGYAAGFRGVDWDEFREEVSPFVEIFSLHGCSLGERAPYPMLHDMGPRDFGSTAEAGWQRGLRFGIVGGSDHHGAYPGSHGDGRMGVFAESLTRDALWEAFLKRRVFAATGDRIDARLFVDGAWIGEVVPNPGTRSLRIAVDAADAVDKVELLKNGRVLRRFFPESDGRSGGADGSCGKLNFTWGWGRKDRLVEWDFELSLQDARITNVETCFSGQAIVAPRTPAEFGETPDDVDLPHELLACDETTCRWRSVTTGNPTMRHASTQSVRLTVEGPLESNLTLAVNGQRYRHRLGELLRAGRSHYLRGWLSEAVRVGPWTPISDCTVAAELTDEPEREVDVYRLQVAQHNGQWAWLTPIWIVR